MRESVIFDTGFDTDYSRDNKVASLPQAWVVLTMPFPTISLRCREVDQICVLIEIIVHYICMAPRALGKP